MARNLSVLRFVEDTNLLERNQGFNKEYAVLTPNKQLPPFQIIVPQGTAALTQIRVFRVETGLSSGNIISKFEANGLSLQRSGYDEQYDDSSLAAQSPGVTKTAWGWSIGDIDSGKMSKCDILINADDTNNLPTKFTARIKQTKSSGTVVLTSTELTDVVVKPNSTFRLYFDFGETYDNSAGDDLYIEVKSDGYWSPVGKDSGYGSGTDYVCSYLDEPSSPSSYDYPDTDVSGSPYGFSGYVRAYEYLGNYDIIKYDGSNIGEYFQQGLHYCVITNGDTVWTSEYFKVVHILDDAMKLIWYHDRPFIHPDGHIRYENFQNYMYLDTGFNNPKYEEEPKYISREGKDFLEQIVTYKLFRVKIVVPEYITDFLSTINQHDHVKVQYKGKEYIIDDFLHTPNDWIENKAEVDLEFKTDTVIIEVGKGVMNSDSSGNEVYKEEEISDITFSDYVFAPITCIDQNYSALDEYLITDSIFTSPATYTGSDNDYMIFVDATVPKLYQYDSSTPTWNLVSLTAYDVVHEIDGDTYYYYGSSNELTTLKTIDSVTDLGGDTYRVDGEALTTASVRLELKDNSGNITYSETWDGQHLINEGITFYHTDIDEVRLHVFGLSCDFGYSSWTSA